MGKPNSTLLPQVALAADDSQPQRAVHTANAVSVFVGGEALVITLGAALTPRATSPERRWALSSRSKT